MRFAKAVLLACALFIGACATTPSSASYIHITDPGGLFSAANWTDDVANAVMSAGWSARADEIKAHMNEKTGWPQKLSEEEERALQPAMIRNYNVREIARLSFYRQPAILLYVPAAANQHMPDGWKPRDDFFIVVTERAVSHPQ
jgi:hypothetical protein